MAQFENSNSMTSLEAFNYVNVNKKTDFQLLRRIYIVRADTIVSSISFSLYVIHLSVTLIEMAQKQN